MDRNGRRKLCSACLSIAGAISLSYVCGAMAMFYRLPSSTWLTNAFLGAQFWHEQHAAAPPSNEPAPAPQAPADVDLPERTSDGFTLYTCVSDTESGMQAFLVNMHREVVHRWAIPFSELRSDAADTHGADPSVCFFGSYLYPNGDLLVVLHGRGTEHCGLARLDAGSKLLWYCPRSIHHDVDVAEDGTIYALESEICYESPAGLEGIPVPYVADSLVALSPEGKLIRGPISILAALRDSPYHAMLETLFEPEVVHEPPSGSTAPVKQSRAKGDRLGLHEALHTNCVRVLPAGLAAKFPLFKPGHVLVSIRNLSILAMLDPVRGNVEWATCGPWFAQHDPQFLANGHLLIFDNLGSPKGSRVLEYDPRTQALPWSYSGAAGGFYTSERGMSQRLPNGNTFIVDSEGGELFEVNLQGQIVWSYAVGRFITSARRVGPGQIHFLSPGTAARPGGGNPDVSSAD